MVSIRNGPRTSCLRTTCVAISSIAAPLAESTPSRLRNGPRKSCVQMARARFAMPPVQAAPSRLRNGPRTSCVRMARMALRSIVRRSRSARSSSAGRRTTGPSTVRWRTRRWPRAEGSRGAGGRGSWARQARAFVGVRDVGRVVASNDLHSNGRRRLGLQGVSSPAVARPRRRRAGEVGAVVYVVIEIIIVAPVAVADAGCYSRGGAPAGCWLSR